MKFKNLMLACSILAMSAASAHAQDMSDQFSVEAGVSTLGVFIAPVAHVNSRLNLRAPLYLGKRSESFEHDGNDIDATINVTSMALMADYHFNDGAMRVSGGLAFGGYKLTADVSNPTLDGTAYTGNFNATLKQKSSIAPVVAVGFNKRLSERWGIAGELGVKIASMELTTTGQEQLSAADQASFNDDVADINKDLSDVGVIPFLSLGVSYKF